MPFIPRHVPRGARGWSSITRGQTGYGWSVNKKAAKQDGAWGALDAIEELAIPADLDRALNANPIAAQYFQAFPRSVMRAILEWIANAKKPETRAKRIEETARLAAQNVRANQWRQ